MIPLKDTIPSRSFPVINTLLIAMNVVVFMFELSLGDERAELLVRDWGVTPYFFAHPSAHAVATLFSSMFLHAGWLHLLSNMLALYIFGDNVEDRAGSGKYLLFYLMCGVAAGLTHVWFNRGSDVPTVGASGAIAGVLGAYLILYPRARVITLIPIFIFPWIVEIPAFIYLGIWFITQLVSGTAMIVSDTARSQAGVAFWAHAGGFVCGMVLIFLFREPQPVVRQGRPQFIDEFQAW